MLAWSSTLSNESRGSLPWITSLVERVHQYLYDPSAIHMKEAMLCGRPQSPDSLYGKTQLLHFLQLNHKVVQVETQGHHSHWLPWPETFLWEHVLPNARRHQETCDNGDAKTLRQPSPSHTSWLSVSSGFSGCESHRQLRAFTLTWDTGTLTLKEIGNLCIQKARQTALNFPKVKATSENKVSTGLGLPLYIVACRRTYDTTHSVHLEHGIVFSCFPNSHKQTWPKKPDAPSPPLPPPHALQFFLCFHIQQYTLAKKKEFSKQRERQECKSEAKPFYILCICKASPNAK